MKILFQLAQNILWCLNLPSVADGRFHCFPSLRTAVRQSSRRTLYLQVPPQKIFGPDPPGTYPSPDLLRFGTTGGLGGVCNYWMVSLSPNIEVDNYGLVVEENSLSILFPVAMFIHFP